MKIRYVRQIFLKGLVAVLPIVATIYIAIWLISSFESIFSPILRNLLPESLYIPGMGVVVGLVGIFLIGLVLQMILARKVWDLGELLLSRTPLISQLYRAFKQVVSYIGGTDQPKGSTVVLVSLGVPKVRMLGLVTQSNVRLGPEQREQDLVSVFLPWSYQIGGFTVLVHRDSIQPVDLTPQEALRFSLTAGVSQGDAPGVRLESE